MAFGRITIDRADKVFSYYVRLSQGKCQRCHSPVEINYETGMPKSHQASHYFSRGKESVRFDEDNVDCLCAACHRMWGGDEREAYTKFKIKQLGQKRFDALQVRAYTTQKKDRGLAYIYWKAKLLEITL